MSTYMHPASDIEERYKRLLRYLTDYIYTVTVYEGMVVDTYHGPGCMAVTGYSSEDYSADPKLWYRMVHEDDREKVTEQASKALAGEDVAPLEHRIIHRDGSIRWVKNSILLSRDKDGYLHYYDGLINDITELKEAERQAQLKQQQLIQADKMVALGILVSGIAHEISNPNNFILLNIELFAKVWEDIKPILQDYYQSNGDFVLAGMPYSRSIHKINEAMTAISVGSQRIREIVRNLTNFARQDSGDLNQDVDIRKVIGNAIFIVDNLIKKSTDFFQVKHKDNLPQIKGNSQQLEQVLINLITNACQSLQSPDKKVTVTTSLNRSEDQILIRVTDEGVGISEENLKRILEPFFTTKREFSGSGLGLSITYNIIKSHGGELIIDSKEGHGTTATMILPVIKIDKKRK